MMCNGTGDGNPALVSKRGNNKPRRRSQILIPIIQLRIDLPDIANIILIQIVLKLLLPVEIVQRLNFILDQVEDNVPVVHVCSYHCHDYLVIQGFELCAD